MNRSATDPSTRSRPPSAYRTASAIRRSWTLPSKPAAVAAMLPVLTLVIRPATVAVTPVGAPASVCAGRRAWTGAVATGGGGGGGAGAGGGAGGGVCAGTVSRCGPTATTVLLRQTLRQSSVPAG